MPDLVVSMGIDDRGVRRGLQSVESVVNRTQSRIGVSGGVSGWLFGKGAERPDTLIKSLTGLSAKFGAVGLAMYGIKKGYEYLHEFEQQLPKAERGLDRLTASSMRFKDSFTSGTELLLRSFAPQIQGMSSSGAGLFDDAINATGDWFKRHWFGFSPLNEGTSADVGDAFTSDIKSIAAFRSKELSLANQKSLEADILSLNGKQYESDLARLEAARRLEYIKIREKAEGGMGPEEVKAEQAALRAREEAGRAKALRDQAERDERELETRTRENQKIVDDAGRRWADEHAAMAATDEYRMRAAERSAIKLEDRVKAAEQRSRLERDKAIETARINATERGIDDDVLARQIQAIRDFADADLAATLRDMRPGKKTTNDGIDLSSAGAVASQGQAFTYSIPGKIDTTNQLLRQSNQMLQRIEQKVDGTPRFGP